MITLYQVGVPPVLIFTGVRDVPLEVVETGRAASFDTFALGIVEQCTRRRHVAPVQAGGQCGSNGFHWLGSNSHAL